MRGLRRAPGGRAPLAVVGPPGRPGERGDRRRRTGRSRTRRHVPSDGTSECWPRSGRAAGAARGSCSALGRVGRAFPDGCDGPPPTLALLAQVASLSLVQAAPDTPLVSGGRVLAAVPEDGSVSAALPGPRAGVAV